MAKGSAARWAAAAHALVTLLAVASVWSVAYLPTHDGPQHIFGLHAANHMDETAHGWSLWLEPSTPLTSNGFSLFFTPFDRWLGWRDATRAALTGLVLVWCVGAWLLARAFDARRAWLGVLLAGGAFQWSLWMGLFSFYVATAFGLWVLALAVSGRSASVGGRVALAGCLLVQALLHVVAAMATGAIVATVLIARAPLGRRALRDVALVGAPAACVALAMAWIGLGDMTVANAGAGDDFQLQWPALWTIARCFFAGPAWRAWPPTLLAASAPLAVWLLRRRGAPSDEELALLSTGAALLVASLAVPLHLRAWDFFSVRFVPLAVCCLLAAWPLEKLPFRAVRVACAAALAGLALASAGWAFAYNRTLAERAAPALAGLDVPLERDGPRMPIILDPYLGRPFDDAAAPVPYAVPLANLGQLYATAQGGIVPHTFALSWQMHPVVLSEQAKRHFPKVVDRTYAVDLAMPARKDDEALRRAIVTYLAGIATGYQDVILWGRPEDADRLVALGFEADWRRDGLLLARFHGCPLTLTFPAEAPPPAGTEVEVGWLPAWHVTRRQPVDRAERDADGATHLDLPTSPCGGVWLRLGGTSAGALACEGADDEGRLLVPSTRATPEVECRLRERHAGGETGDAPVG